MRPTQPLSARCRQADPAAPTSSGRVLVLNASYEPINVCTVRRATVLVLKERAEILERGDWALHAECVTLPGRSSSASRPT